MAQIIRDRFIKPKNKPPCVDCNDRDPGCHSKCAKYIEWKKNYMEYKIAIKDHIRKVARCEEYEISQKLKISRKKCREI